MESPSAIVERLYGAVLEPALWPQALHELAQAVGAVGTVVLPVSTQGARETLISPEMREANEAYQKGWWRHDSRVQRMQMRRVLRGVFSEPELFAAEELARDPFRQEFLRQFGMGAFAAQVVAPLPKLVVSISVQRTLARGPFEAHEIERLALLGKHAARAVSVALRLAAARAGERTLVGTLDRLPCGGVAVDTRGRTVFVNQAAERMLGDGITISQKQLRAASAEQQPALDHLIASAQAGAKAALAPIALARRSARTPLLLQAIPIRRSHADAIDRFLFESPTVLVLIVDPEQEREHDPAAALRLLGLTQAEARIAALVGCGRSRREAAEVLGISEWTARETIKRVFAKLGISRQSELVKLVYRLSVFMEPR
jgi:DNA-binding CsgD family transcriptional regulator/PAS domain-containing protein